MPGKRGKNALLCLVLGVELGSMALLVVRPFIRAKRDEELILGLPLPNLTLFSSWEAEAFPLTLAAGEENSCWLAGFGEAVGVDMLAHSVSPQRWWGDMKPYCRHRCKSVYRDIYGRMEKGRKRSKGHHRRKKRSGTESS